MKYPNKSFYYLLPLINGWAAKADLPIDCYAKSRIANALILKYPLGALRMHPGIPIVQDEEYEYIASMIDSKYLSDYKIILDGEYSRISENTKNIIISRISNLSDSQRVEQILYKTKKLKKYLETFLMLKNIDEYTEEYDSKMFNEEQFNFIEYDETIDPRGEPESVAV